MPPRPKVLLALVAVLLLAAFFMVRTQLAAVVLAAVFAYLVQPMHQWLSQKVRYPWISAACLLLLVSALLILPIVILGLRLLQDAMRLAQRIESREDLQQQVGEALDGLGLPEGVVEQASARIVGRVADYLQGAVVPLATLATEFVIALFVFFLLLYYLIMDGPRLAQWIVRHTPAPRDRMDQLCKQAGKRIHGIVLGTFLVALIQATIAGVGWWLLGLPYPMFWAFVMLVLELVPLLGSFIVLVPATVWAFSKGMMFEAGALIALNFVFVGLIDNILRPYLIGRRGGVHPALVLLGIAGGIPVFGISGFILGPLLMSMIPAAIEAWSGNGEATREAQPRLPQDSA